MKKIAILGSTGSIGTQTLEIVREHKDIQVTALAAGSNVILLEQQIREFRPLLAVLWEEQAAKDLQVRVRDLDVKILFGMEGLLAIAVMPGVEILVTTIALANKETLVTAGHIIMPLAKENNVPILPVDSEHSAIFQSLNGEKGNSIHKILLTASGGPFRGKRREDLLQIRVEDALQHPNWSMGKKITIDSATMVNKGLEVMEAKWLFDVELEQIQVLVHPQSIIHSMVEYEDGAVLAQLGTPDMRLPIQYALYYPCRRSLSGKRLDFFQLASLTFEKPDLDTFPGLGLAFQAMKRGGNIPTVYNAANEKAVALFLEKKISFLEIPELIQFCMEQSAFVKQPDVAQILETEAAVYDLIESRW